MKYSYLFFFHCLLLSIAPYSLGVEPSNFCLKQAVNDEINKASNLDLNVKQPFNQLPPDEQLKLVYESLTNPIAFQAAQKAEENKLNFIDDNIKKASSDYTNAYHLKMRTNTTRANCRLKKAQLAFVEALSRSTSLNVDPNQLTPSEKVHHKAANDFAELAKEMGNAVGKTNTFHDLATTEYNKIANMYIDLL